MSLSILFFKINLDFLGVHTNILQLAEKPDFVRVYERAQKIVNSIMHDECSEKKTWEIPQADPIQILNDLRKAWKWP